MFGFGSSSSSSSNEPPQAPNREQRAACWRDRDAYFDCLFKNKVLQPGDEKLGPDGKPLKEGTDACSQVRSAYEGSCSKSWVEYFNKRRTLEFRQKATMEAAARQGVQVPGR